ncbi:unnamed protein product [Heligmosomoides polygyrus]|uniref:Mediator of RNA polymerase II transcription subunit 17 n=1 Tax=Heligmosomoides polygyrus TaxID=6339 RepID=A0A183GH88_HELPZ|nr:unnamed protein product [Heligmosomoides polygyrus]
MLKCDPPAHVEVWSTLDKDPSREGIKLADRMASILEDFEARQREVDKNKQLEVVEEEEEDWDLQDELIDMEKIASSRHTIAWTATPASLSIQAAIARGKTLSIRSIPSCATGQIQLADMGFFS